MKAGELTAQGAEIFRPLQETSMHDDIATILHLACCMEHIWPCWQSVTEDG